MPIVCLCNNFNKKQIEGAFDALGEQLSKQPSLEEIYQFYRDVYEWCGLEYYQQEGKKPQCHACFATFVDQAIERFLERHCQQALSLSDSAHNVSREQVMALAKKA